MQEAIIAFASALAGAIAGSYSAWYLSQRSTRNQSRREALIKTCQDLEILRVAYGQWYTEYVHNEKLQGCTWARPATGQPDTTYLAMMTTVDNSRGALRVDQALLAALMPRCVAVATIPMIDKVLVMTSPQLTAHSKECDEVANETIEKVTSYLPQFAK
jgi:hypothetical protein